MRGVVSVTQPLVGVLEATTVQTLGDVAERRFVAAHVDDSMFDLFHRLSGSEAERALVVHGNVGAPTAADVAGVISKRYIADAVLAHFRSYHR